MVLIISYLNPYIVNNSLKTELLDRFQFLLWNLKLHCLNLQSYPNKTLAQKLHTNTQQINSYSSSHGKLLWFLVLKLSNTFTPPCCAARRIYIYRQIIYQLWPLYRESAFLSHIYKVRTQNPQSSKPIPLLKQILFYLPFKKG